MHRRPQVSVIVPLYNKERWIQRTLDSISRQTFQDFEVLVVDDGSTDRSPEIARAYPDSRIRLLSQANGGPGAARNLGIREANSDFLAFLDADDEWRDDYLSKGLRGFEEGVQIASSTCGHLLSPGERSTERMWRKRGVSPGPSNIDANATAASLVHMLAYMLPCTTIVKRKVAVRWGGFYAQNGCKYAEDAHFWLKILLNERVYFDMEPRVILHADASELSRDRRKVRPLEPFLADPDSIREVCPDDLRCALERFFSIRAFKTACAWSYAGAWREARALRKQYADGAMGLPYYWASLACATPFGSLGAKLMQGLFL